MSAPQEGLDHALLAEISAREAALARDTEGRLAERAGELRRRAAAGAPLDDLLPACFALARESARRELGERPYDVQVLAGIALHRGRLVEMQTGEGKTLAAVAPVALHALAGRGVHVLTFNDYLARRDAAWMGPVYRRLGLEVACVQEGMTAAERRRAYRADVTYVTVKEAGFDLLRDGLCLEPGAQVHRPFHLGLVDEADSLLIDEARIPLVLAGTFEEPAADLGRLAEVARLLQRGADWEVSEYARNVYLTDRGARRAEELLGADLFEDATATGGGGRLAELRNALHAEALLRRDVDYIVRRGRIELVDELTGRVAEDRHWPDGLQSALEAKERLPPRPEGKVFGTITIQHLLRRYPRLCGMTATATPAAAELARVYGLEITPVPPHRPCRRIDHPDLIFATRAAKRRAVRAEVAAAHAAGRPVLVGTVSVEESEELAAELRAAGIPCRVLNARNDAEEADIVASAGARGAVTISTNMAGRGTDIRLGAGVAELGGLFVIGTNRHESRRIDDQLRGRAGRQGDPGASRFFVSLEDPLLVRCGIDKLLPARLRETLRRAAEEGEDGLLDHAAVRKEVARVQRIAEGQHGDLRRRLLGTWQVLEHQRTGIQEWRQGLLEGREPAPGESLLARRSPERWNRLAALYGEELLLAIERRLTLVTLDRCWSDHLAELQAVRDEVHLVQLGGLDPYAEFCRRAEAAFDALLERIDDTAVEVFERIAITADGVDWEREGLRGPSSTWTYLVDDNVYGNNTFLSLANNTAFGLWAMLVAGWLLFPWALVLRWRRRQRSRRDPAA